MMILRSSPPSPFGRKVKLAAAVLGLTDQIKIEVTDTSDPGLKRQNPLAKIPTLVLDDGFCLYDSAVICEYLDSLKGSTLFPSGAARWPALRLAALADGLMEAALLLVYEKRIRPEGTWNAQWIEMQQQKIDAGLDHLEQVQGTLGAKPDIGEIGLACALGYLDLRHQGKWRATHPKLVAWLDDFAAKVPAFEATRVKA
ncbi:MAG: glutathione S-transferase family protein [Hyphomicrobiaceae bacterium]